MKKGAVQKQPKKAEGFLSRKPSVLIYPIFNLWNHFYEQNEYKNHTLMKNKLSRGSFFYIFTPLARVIASLNGTYGG